LKILLRVALLLGIGAAGFVTVQAVLTEPGATVVADPAAPSDKPSATAPGLPDAAAGGEGEPAGENAPVEASPPGDSEPASGTPKAEPAEAEAPADRPSTEPREAPGVGSGAAGTVDPASAEAKAAILLVNKQNSLDASYKPDDLVVPDVKFSFDGDNPKKQLQRVAAEALERLFAAAEKDGIELRAVSGYRSYATQKAIFERNAKLKGEAEANRTSAYPGQSEHQTGLAMDVSAASVNYALEEAFGETVEGIWLAEHAAEFGFIIRYPQEKEDITGYKYEPWHLRYVGVDVAEYVTAQGLTLEEYVGEPKKE